MQVFVVVMSKAPGGQRHASDHEAGTDSTEDLDSTRPAEHSGGERLRVVRGAVAARAARQQFNGSAEQSEVDHGDGKPADALEDALALWEARLASESLH